MKVNVTLVLKAKALEDVVALALLAWSWLWNFRLDCVRLQGPTTQTSYDP